MRSNTNTHYQTQFHVRWICTVVLAVLCVAPSLRAQPALDRFAGIAPKMQEFVDQGEVSGIVTLVADKDKVLHLAAVGKSDLATGRATKTDDIFWIASMSKPITAACIGILKDDGKLSFDDPLAKYLPEFDNPRSATDPGALRRGQGRSPPPLTASNRLITIRDVLTHTSGLGEATQRQPHPTLAATSELIAIQPRRFLPGTRWQYSTAGIDVLGRVVEVAGGMPFDQFLQKRVLDPLEMKNTSFWIAPDQESRVAHSYRNNAQSGKLEEAPISYLYNTAITDRQRPPLGGAGLFSTAEDVGRFYQMTMNNGSWKGKQILKPETLAEMLRKQTGVLTARAGMPWGLGFCIVEDPSAMEANHMLAPGSFGHGGAFGTSSWVDPTKGVAYIIMLQRSGLPNPDNSDMHRVFQEVAAAALKQ